MELKYQEHQLVYGHKQLRNGRRWCQATALYVVRLPDDEHPNDEAWMLEFKDGSRGAFDADHMKPWP